MAVLDEFRREIPSLGNELHHPHHHRGRHSPSSPGQPPHLRNNSRSLSPEFSRQYHRDHERRSSRERDDRVGGGDNERLVDDHARREYEERHYPTRSRSTSPSHHFRRSSSSHNGRDSPRSGAGGTRRRSPSRERGGYGMAATMTNQIEVDPENVMIDFIVLHGHLHHN